MLAAVLALAFVMNMLGRGATEMFAVFLLPVEKALHATRSEMSGVYSLFMLVIGLSGPFAGAVFDRLGARASYGMGLVLLGGSLYVAGLATQVWHYAASVGFAAGLGVSMLGMVSANGLLARWYERRLGTAIGVTYAATGFGVLVGAPLAQVLIAALGWRDAYHWIGGALLAIAVATMLLPLGRMSRGTPAWQARRAAQDASRSDWSIGRAARTPAFWALALVYFLTSLASFSVSPQAVAAMVEAGISPLAAAGAFGLCGMLSLIGNASISPLVDRFGQRLMITLSYLGTVIGILCLAVLPSHPSMLLVYAWVLLFGINQGTRGPVISTLVATLFAGGGVGRVYGTIALGMGFGAASGSWLSGILHDMTGGYLASFLVAAGAAALGMATFWTVPLLDDARAASRAATRSASV
ncbi:MAG: MFS transporter [Hyphomicrobiaceae bacterium]